MNLHRQRGLVGVLAYRDPNADSPLRLSETFAVCKGLRRAAKCENFPLTDDMVGPQRERRAYLALVA
jgi:hypothetical protein